MVAYLLLQKNNRVFLLVRYPDRYHIIAVNHKLDEEKEEKVLSGYCSDAAMDEMGLTRETVMMANLRGVGIGGCRAGDAVVLYMKDRKLKYVLSDDGDENIDAVFAGIERFQAPKNVGSKSRKRDWRTELQTEPMGKIMGIIGSGLNVCGGVCLVGTALFGRLSMVWPAICLLTMAAAIGMYLVYPQYFSMMGSTEYKRAGYTAKVKHVRFAILAPAFILSVQILVDFYFFNWWPLIIAGGIVGIAVTILMHIFSREVNENASLSVLVLLLAIFFSWGVIGEINHIANFHAEEPQILTVADTRKVNGAKGSTRYYCIATEESGREMKIPISRSNYEQLQPGDKASIYIGEGAFGIEYAYFLDEA